MRILAFKNRDDSWSPFLTLLKRGGNSSTGLLKMELKLECVALNTFRGKKFVCIVVLHPRWSSATVHRIPWNMEESEKAVERISKKDPQRRRTNSRSGSSPEEKNILKNHIYKLIIVVQG